jgi:hypothetical protein
MEHELAQLRVRVAQLEGQTSELLRENASLRIAAATTLGPKVKIHKAKVDPKIRKLTGAV